MISFEVLCIFVMKLFMCVSVVLLGWIIIWKFVLSGCSLKLVMMMVILMSLLIVRLRFVIL